MTVSPFPGNVQVYHRIKVKTIANHTKIQIEGTVHYDDDLTLKLSSCCWFNTIGNMMQQCFMPTIDQYVDQVLSSMATVVIG